MNIRDIVENRSKIFAINQGIWLVIIIALFPMANISYFPPGFCSGWSFCAFTLVAMLFSPPQLQPSPLSKSFWLRIDFLLLRGKDKFFPVYMSGPKQEMYLLRVKVQSSLQISSYFPGHRGEERWRCRDTEGSQDCTFSPSREAPGLLSEEKIQHFY